MPRTKDGKRKHRLSVYLLKSGVKLKDAVEGNGSLTRYATRKEEH